MMKGVPLKVEIHTGMGLKELGERLSRLKELYKDGGVGTYWEAARLLEDELEPFGLCFQWDDTEEAFCVYNTRDMKD